MDFLKLKDADFRDKEIIESLNKFIGNNLRAIIADKGMKQIEVAADIGLQESSFKTILGGGHAIDTTKYIAFMVLYGINPLEIMLGKDYIKILAMFPERDRKGREIISQEDYVLGLLDEALIETKKMDPDTQERILSKMATKIVIAK